MWDILEEISRISITFQKDSIPISQVKAETQRASQALENMRRRSGRYLAGFQEEDLEMEPCSKGPVFQGTTQMTECLSKAKE